MWWSPFLSSLHRTLRKKLTNKIKLFTTASLNASTTSDNCLTKLGNWCRSVKKNITSQPNNDALMNSGKIQVCVVVLAYLQIIYHNAPTIHYHIHLHVNNFGIPHTIYPPIRLHQCAD